MECSSLPSVASQGETKRSLECLETGKASGILGRKNEKVRMNFLGFWAGLRVRMEDQQRERERERQRMVVGVFHSRLGIVAS